MVRPRPKRKRWWQTPDAWSRFTVWYSRGDADVRRVLRWLLSGGDVERSGRMMWNVGMLVDSEWDRLDKRTRAFVSKRIVEVMIKATGRRGDGLWKLGDSLGDHIGEPWCLEALARVIKAGRTPEARIAALHGLVHYAYERKRSRRAISDLIGHARVAENEPHVKRYARACLRAVQGGDWCCPRDDELAAAQRSAGSVAQRGGAQRKRHRAQGPRNVNRAQAAMCWQLAADKLRELSRVLSKMEKAIARDAMRR
jgi:hypothetical protein